jgi:hypothetical protein
LTSAARALDSQRRALLGAAVQRTILAHPEAEMVVDTRTLTTCPPVTDESTLALVCRSFAPGAGDYYIVPRAGSFIDPLVVPGKGVGHGTPHLYNRTVPLVVRAPGRVAAGAIVEESVEFGAFARTAAALLGVPPPSSASTARDLTVQ